MRARFELLDSDRVAKDLAGEDVVVSAVSFRKPPDPAAYRKAAVSLVAALRTLGARAPRLILVGDAGSLRDSWSPVGSIGSAGGSGAPGGFPGGPRPGGASGPSIGTTMPPQKGGGFPGGPRPPSEGNPGGAETAKATGKTPQRERTEFIILFVWQEPTPSDLLRGFDDATAPTPPQ